MNNVKSVESIQKDRAIIYHNPNCSKSCYALECLEKYNININLDIKLYLTTGINRQELFNILTLLNCDIIDIVRTKEQIFIDQYSSKHMSLSKERFISMIIENPLLMERPIILFPGKNIGAIVRSDNSLSSLFNYVGISLL